MTLAAGLLLCRRKYFPQQVTATLEARTLRSLPADIWVTSHARDFGRYRKFRERATAKDPVKPFIDREGYLAYIDSAEARYRRLIAK